MKNSNIPEEYFIIMFYFYVSHTLVSYHNQAPAWLNGKSPRAGPTGLGSHPGLTTTLCMTLNNSFDTSELSFPPPLTIFFNDTDFL